MEAETEGVTDTTTFDVFPGAPAIITIEADPRFLPSDGTTQSNIVGSLEDNWTNPISDATLLIETNLGTATTVVNQGDGTYTSQITSTIAGLATITASLSDATSAQTTVAFSDCMTPADPDGGTNGCPIQYGIVVTVIEEQTGLAIENAFVQVGLAPDDPFAGNYGYTDSTGSITFMDPTLTGPVTVTAGVPGSEDLAFFTISEVDANHLVLPLKNQNRLYPETSEISGDVDGFVTVNNDGIFDAGLVIPAFSIESVLTLNYEMFMGDWVTRELPLGQSADLPGNIYAPSQTELLFATIAFSPYLGLHVENNAFHDFYCLGGNIGLSEMIDLLTQPDPDITEALSLFTFTKAGISRNQYITEDATIDFTLTNTANYDLTINVDNTPADSDVYLVTVADMDEMAGLGSLVPMGVNLVAGGSAQSMVLSTIEKTGDFAAYDTVAGAAITDNLGNGITTQVKRTGLAPGSTADIDTFFSFISGMTQTEDQFSFDSPENGVSPALDIQASAIGLNNTAAGQVIYEWDILGADTVFTLPALPLTGDDYPLTNPGETPEPDFLQWELSGYGLTLDQTYDFDHFAFENIKAWMTHFTYNWITIQFTK